MVDTDGAITIANKKRKKTKKKRGKKDYSCDLIEQKSLEKESFLVERSIFVKTEHGKKRDKSIDVPRDIIAPSRLNRLTVIA